MDSWVWLVLVLEKQIGVLEYGSNGTPARSHPIIPSLHDSTVPFEDERDPRRPQSRNSAIAPPCPFPQYPAPNFLSCAGSIHFI